MYVAKVWKVGALNSEACVTSMPHNFVTYMVGGSSQNGFLKLRLYECHVGWDVIQW
jgi:hypothetical protein